MLGENRGNIPIRPSEKPSKTASEKPNPWNRSTTGIALLALAATILAGFFVTQHWLQNDFEVNGPFGKVTVIDGKVSGTNGFPDEFGQTITDFLENVSITVSSTALAFLPQARGSFEGPLVAPVETVVASSAPLFSWEEIKPGAEYRVTIYGNETLVHNGDWTKELEWKSPPDLLMPGTIYKWNLDVRMDGKDLELNLAEFPSFRTLSVNERLLLSEGLIRAKNSSLARIVVFAKFGLKDEIRSELDSIERLNPNSPIVAKLRSSLE